MKKIWSGLQKRFADTIGLTKEREAAKGWSPDALTPDTLIRFRRQLGRHWHPDVRMRRGIQIAMEKAQRGRRLARILVSTLQGLEVRKEFRRKQLERRTA